MKWLFVSMFIVHTLPCILSGPQKKVKILVPMPVQHIHHTKVVKVPEYHHYFHDRKQPHQKRYQQFNNHNDFVAYNDKDPALYDELNYFPNSGYNDFESYPEAHSDAFHDRQHTPPLPQQFYSSHKDGGNKRHAHYPKNSNRRRNPYEPQHFYHKF